MKPMPVGYRGLLARLPPTIAKRPSAERKRQRKKKKKGRKGKKRKEKKRKEKKRKEKKRKEKKGKERKGKESILKTTPFGINFMRSQVLYQAAQASAESCRKKREKKFTLFSDHDGSLLRWQPGALKAVEWLL